MFILANPPSEAKDIEQLKQSLYALDYNDIIKLLFTPKWLDDDEKDKIDLISQIKNKEMSSKQLINYINTIKPKSNWDRLFVPQIGKMSNIEEAIDELRELRNRVAHCKFFRKKHYETCLRLLRTLNRKVNKALKVVMSIDFQELNSEYAYNSLEVLSNSIKEFGKGISEMLFSSLEPLTSMAVNSASNALKRFADSIVPTLLYSFSNSKPAISGFKSEQNKKYTKNKNV